jgi:hypothetical protein
MSARLSLAIEIATRGWNEKPASGTPRAVHFTRGGPWFDQWKNVDYADLWLAEREDTTRAKEKS